MAATSIIRSSFSSGEIAPTLWGRTDLSIWHSGCSTLRNCYVDYRSGASSRPGTGFVGQSKVPGENIQPRLISYQFSVDVAFGLEFGDRYMRVIFRGAYVTQAPFSITGVSQSNPCVVQAPGHNFVNGDWIAISEVQGMTELNGITFITANVVPAASFTLLDTFGDSQNSLAFDAYTGGGNAARIYEIASPYALEDLPYLKFTQSSDEMSLTCVNTVTGTEYPPYDLVAFAPDNWQLTQTDFSPGIQAPSSVTVVATNTTGSNPTRYKFQVTAVKDGRESVASNPGSVNNSVNIGTVAGSLVVTWSPVPQADYYNIYKAPAAYNSTVPIGSSFGYAGDSRGTQFVDSNIVQDFTRTPPRHLNPFARGAIQYVTVTNGGSGYNQDTVSVTINTTTGSGAVILPVVVGGSVVAFIVENGGENYRSTDTITVSGGVSGSGATATIVASPTDGTNGGSLGPVTVTNGGSQYTNPVATVPPPGGGGVQATLSPPVVQGGVITAIYVNNPGTLYSPAPAVTIVDAAPSGANATADLVVGPLTGTYPSVVEYVEQRRCYAASLNAPDTYHLSQPGRGLYTNFDSSSPPIDSDAITGTPWSRQVNGIQWIVPMPGATIMMTGGGLWQVSGIGGEPLAPSSQEAISQEYIGVSATVPPIRIKNSLLYLQSKGAIVNDIQFNFMTSSYTGDDISFQSNHLFEGRQIVQWAWAQEPWKIAWAVRDDGKALSLTYVKDQKLSGWGRHDTNGLFVGVTVVSELPVDAPYWVVKRYIPAKQRWAYYIERMDDRLWSNAEDCWCVDSGLELKPLQPSATLSTFFASGNGRSFTADAPVFNGTTVGAPGQIIRMGGGQAQVVSFISGTEVIADILLPITDTVPYSTGNIPSPARAGKWSIATPVTNIRGLNHLEGFVVTGLLDGAVMKPQVVVNGQVNVERSVTVGVIGLSFNAQLQTMHADVQGAPSIQNKRQKTGEVTLRMVKSRGVKMGTNQPNASAQENQAEIQWGQGTQEIGKMIEYKHPLNALSAHGYLPLFTGDLIQPPDSDWDTTGMIAFEQSNPLPMGVAAVISNLSLGDSNSR